MIEITNNSNQVQDFNIVAENAFCEDINRSKQSLLKQEILNAQKTGPLVTTSISANSTVEFYVKISRQGNTKLSTFNCTSIRAVSVTNTDISNSLIINSFIPDPKNFN
ncbi:hypothetical protein CA834_09635 [Winogradskyella aurantia]|uniref:Uncharacterized protein n=1 Tax=Winogradskyella aurantia TaxID=1915063 RepID=A0A265UU14_9FLAO|nr:hypothetical protein CA834_09635 [Winogradskyella aurantia]